MLHAYEPAYGCQNEEFLALLDPKLTGWDFIDFLTGVLGFFAFWTASKPRIANIIIGFIFDNTDPTMILALGELSRCSKGQKKPKLRFLGI